MVHTLAPRDDFRTTTADGLCRRLRCYRGPGVWQPTPPGFLTALTPWLGQMRPLTMNSPSQFLPDGPTPLTGERWVVEHNTTRLLGEMNSTLRTAAQSEIGTFWAVHTGQ
jgi:hypothetical protein